MTVRDWVELFLLVILTFSSVVRWIQSRETSDADLAARVKKLEDADLETRLAQLAAAVKTLEEAEIVDPSDVASLRRGLAELKGKQDADHGQQRRDREVANAAVGTVAVDVAGHRERITSLEKRVDRVERRQDQPGG